MLRYNLKSVRAYLLKEDFQQLWTYQSPTWAGKFLDEHRPRELQKPPPASGWCIISLTSLIITCRRISSRFSWSAVRQSQLRERA